MNPHINPPSNPNPPSGPAVISSSNVKVQVMTPVHYREVLNRDDPHGGSCYGGVVTELTGATVSIYVIAPNTQFNVRNIVHGDWQGSYHLLSECPDEPGQHKH